MMKKFLIVFIFLTLKYCSFAQLTYEELKGLQNLCRKDDMTAVQIFLTNEGFNINETHSNYDNGNYFVLMQVEAKKILGELKTAYMLSLHSVIQENPLIQSYQTANVLLP